MKIACILTYINTMILVSIATILGVMWASDSLPIKIVTSLDCDIEAGTCTENLDAINIASQLGRLDFASFALAIFGVTFGVGAIFSFLFIRDHAEREAIKAAEKETENYLRRHLSSLVDQGISSVRADASSDEANQMAAEASDDNPTGGE